MTDEQILAALLALNLDRSASGDVAPTAPRPKNSPRKTNPSNHSAVVEARPDPPEALKAGIVAMVKAARS